MTDGMTRPYTLALEHGVEHWFETIDGVEVEFAEVNHGRATAVTAEMQLPIDGIPRWLRHSSKVPLDKREVAVENCRKWARGHIERLK